MLSFDFSILQCPITKKGLIHLSKEETLALLNDRHSDVRHMENITEGFINATSSYFYPVFGDILLLLPVYALYIGNEEDMRKDMSYDKKRVFDYYNQINYDTRNSLSIYQDSPKWVDFRDISHDYLHRSFQRAGRYLNPGGKYFLDIASGPIGLKEYMDLSEGYATRICADISVNALIQAKFNYRHRKGIFICADIANIPLKENTCDAVLCQHTLYHLPKNEQKTAVNELYRVAAPGASVAIVYSLFHHSWFMNLALLPLQGYRIARHFAGKAWVSMFHGKPRLYFYPHSLRWFRRSFTFGDRMKFYCWRSTNKYFLKIYIHKWMAGKKILQWLADQEDRHPQFWGRIGEYPVIVIRKE